MLSTLAAALALIAGIMLYVACRNQPAAAQRLDDVMQSSGLHLPASTLQEDLSRTVLRRLLGLLARAVQGGLTQLTPVHWRDLARLKMQRLGRDNSAMLTGYLLCRVILTMTAVAAGACVLLQVQGPPLLRSCLLLLVVVLTLVLPDAILNGEIKRRQDEIRVALPDVTDLLAVSTEAGVGLDGALAIVVKRKPGPLSEEFRRLLLEIRLGAERQAAWGDLVTRVGVSELQALVGSLQDAEQTGVSIANTLRAQADAMRVKRAILIRQLAATLPVKMLFPLVFFILPALFVVLMGPGAIAMYKAVVLLE